MVLQGQIEATEIRISGKLPGRIDSFLVEEGEWVKAGDTLVVINSPTIEAKYRQVNALEQVAQEQNKKIDAGTRRQISCHSPAAMEQDAKRPHPCPNHLPACPNPLQRQRRRRAAKGRSRSHVQSPHRPPNEPRTNNTKWQWTVRREDRSPRRLPAAL